jgi:predicted RNA binding protein YcfA (HicA-like mRNA interferase family)
MGTTDKLIHKARTSPYNLTYDELCLLAERIGFVFRNQTGSHKIYKHPIHKKIMNFQPDKRNKGKAKMKQIKQLVEFIDEFMPKEEKSV